MVLRARTLANHAVFMKDLTIIFHTSARLELDTHIVYQGGTEDVSTNHLKNFNFPWKGSGLIFSAVYYRYFSLCLTLIVISFVSQFMHVFFSAANYGIAKSTSDGTYRV